MNVTIYHNPACSTSRKVLDAIRATGVEPQIVEYLKQPPDRATLESIVAATGQPARKLVRDKGNLYAELGLDDPKWTDAQLIDFMLQHPVLINRPVVVTPLGARLCRPVEMLLEVLPQKG